jgi:hypothetical protein
LPSAPRPDRAEGGAQPVDDGERNSQLSSTSALLAEAWISPESASKAARAEGASSISRLL